MTKRFVVALVALFLLVPVARTQTGAGNNLIKGQPDIENAEIAAGAAIAASKLESLVVQESDIGDGLEASGGTIHTLSNETGFLEDGGAAALTCGTTNNGRMQVSNVAGLLEWCDGQATATLASVGNLGATIDDTEMTNEDFGEFTCDGSEDGCTLDAEVYAFTELSDIGSTTGTGTVGVLGTNPTLTDVTVNDVVFFTETAGDDTCAAGDFWIKANSTSNLLRGCENGSLFTLSAGGTNPLSLDSPEVLTVTTDAVTFAGAVNSWNLATLGGEGDADDTLSTCNCTLGAAYLVRAENDTETITIACTSSPANFILDNADDYAFMYCEATNTMRFISRVNGGE